MKMTWSCKLTWFPHSLKSRLRIKPRSLSKSWRRLTSDLYSCQSFCTNLWRPSKQSKSFSSNVRSFFSLRCIVIATFPTEIHKVSPQQMSTLLWRSSWRRSFAFHKSRSWCKLRIHLLLWRLKMLYEKRKLLLPSKLLCTSKSYKFSRSYWIYHWSSRCVLTSPSHQKRALSFMLMRKLSFTVASDPNDQLQMLFTGSKILTKYVFKWSEWRSES